MAARRFLIPRLCLLKGLYYMPTWPDEPLAHYVAESLLDVGRSLKLVPRPKEAPKNNAAVLINSLLLDDGIRGPS